MTDHAKADQVTTQPSPVFLTVSRQVIMTLCIGAIVGAVLSLACAGLYSGGMRRVLLAYLVAFAYVLSLSLGSLFFVLLQHLMRAGWGVLVRRPAEILSLNVITVAVLFLPIAWSVVGGNGELYPWARRESHNGKQHVTPISTRDGQLHLEPAAISAGRENEHLVSNRPEATEHGSVSATHDVRDSLYAHQTVDDLTRSKQVWLNPGAYLTRIVFFFAVWTLIAGFYFLRSRHQDTAADNRDTRRMEWWSGLAVFAFGMTLTYAAFDLLMSLDPHWYSTIFGVYYFSGCAVGGFSIILLSVLLLERHKVLPAILSDEHRRDLGRLLFAFVIFWCYIAFSQYMLLWYANVPETTRWLVVRGASLAEGYGNSWGYLLVILLIGHFVIPFLGIMSRHVKSSQRAMIFWTIWLLVMHYFDLYWLVMPELGPHFTLGLPELSTLVFVFCAYTLGASIIATRTSLVPIGDPRLGTSLVITDAY